MAQQGKLVEVGRIAGLYGVQGWLRVHSGTEPRENILKYSPWYLRVQGEWVPLKPVSGRSHGNGVVVRLAGYEDRDAAARLVGADIAVTRDQFPQAGPGEYYWSDLIGLRVVTTGGIELGTVDHLLETGANDVLVIKGDRERLIPYVPGEFVVSIDLEAGLLTVEWDPEF